ncbi:MAG: hypothetical protein ACTS22_09770 [Phycisphaerales bacterium]
MAESARRLAVRARFGLPVDRGDRRRRAAALRARATSDAKRLIDHLPPGAIALVTGPSGAGKSLILRALARRVIAVSAEPLPRRSARAPVDLIDRPLDEALTLLSRLGLADARRLVTPGGRLSEGERARLAIAVAFDQAAATPWVVVDEFASALDTPTAESLACSVRRALPTGTRLVCATARDEIIAPLRPDLLVYVPFDAPAEFHDRAEGTCARPAR